MDILNSETEPTSFTPPGGRSRLRISTSLIKALGWDQFEEDFQCYGVFRKPGEVLIAPTWVSTPDGEHPFTEMLGLLEKSNPTEIRSIRDIPSGASLTARYRIFSFDTSWKNGKKQLDLNMGAKRLEQLGWIGNLSEVSRIFGIDVQPVLVLMSETRYQQLSEIDIFE